MRVLKQGRENIDLTGLVLEGRVLHAYWYQRPGSQRFLMASVAGFTTRIWDDAAHQALNTQKGQINQSINAAIRLARHNLHHPFQGGIPGSGKRQ